MNYKELLVEWGKKRAEIYNKNLDGMSYSQLAREYNLTSSRIGAIINQERKRLGITKNKKNE